MSNILNNFQKILATILPIYQQIKHTEKTKYKTYANVNPKIHTAPPHPEGPRDSFGVSLGPSGRIGIGASPRKNKLIQSKAEIHIIESQNCRVRHYLARFCHANPKDSSPKGCLSKGILRIGIGASPRKKKSVLLFKIRSHG